jgi:hypothetical protein
VHAGDHRLSLHTEVVAVLHARHLSFAVIGAAALADPPAGVVRLTAAGESPIDLMVGRDSWQARALTAQVEAARGELPEEARRLWARVADSR